MICISNKIISDIKIPKRKAFLELLLELSEQGTRFTDEELREEVDTLMVAVRYSQTY